MAQLVFRCGVANRLITTGIEVDPLAFSKIHVARTIRCRFCGQDHAWEIVDHLTEEMAAFMSVRAENYLGRSVQDETLAALANDPLTRDLYERMAEQWWRLSVEAEERAGPYITK